MKLRTIIDTLIGLLVLFLAFRYHAVEFGLIIYVVWRLTALEGENTRARHDLGRLGSTLDRHQTTIDGLATAQSGSAMLLLQTRRHLRLDSK